MSDDNLGGLGDLLSQGDIESLMAEARGDSAAIGVIFNSEGDRIPSSANVKVSVCDFRNPVFLTDTEMRQVRMRQETFLHYLSARLSMFTRMDVSMKMSKLDMVPFVEFTEDIQSPTFINIFRIKGLNGVGLVNVNPRLAMTLVNRMLGGKGHGIIEERYLTDIEMALMEDAVKLMLDEWCNIWVEMEDLQPNIVGRENNGRFLQTSVNDAVMLVLDIETSLGDVSAQIQIGVPYHMIDPMIKSMRLRNTEIGKSQLAEKAQKWLPNYDKINVPVVAEWNAFEIKVSDLLRLKEGDILLMPSDIIGKTNVRVNNATLFEGEVGVEDNHVAVKLNKVIDKSEE
jgi:flagellar motor switch protein FliM